MDQRPMARFLRDRRARLDPTDVGLPLDGPRRTAGLRREEVATLAHISASYYSQLEQARASRPSSDVLNSLSHALRLSDDERTLLFTLSGRSPDSDTTNPRRDVTPSVLDLINRMPGTAALILDAKFDILAWNHLAAALFEDFSTVEQPKRNLIRAFFLEADTAQRHYGVNGSEDFAKLAASQLRAAAERYPRDGEIRALIAELRSTSAEFENLWHQVDTVVPRHQMKSMTHPMVGPLELHCNLLMVPDRDQHIVVFTAEPGTPSHQALSLLSVIGTQNMTSVGGGRPPMQQPD
ncbi:helix-turn-helix transcriptional regulator [Mycolicibacterium hippocampi]|nr:helix-turn-helix transcriptional regulator [Mycolicibacterium hippocampi]